MEQVYQVFVNHRGPDTKRNLASLIYHRLTSCNGLSVFLDQDELHTGNTVYPAIRRAIDSSSVHIALFSKRYAESRACLNELCWMMQRSSHERTIIPVFCDIEPHDLNGIDRPPYGAAFEKHHRDVDAGKVKMEDIQRWKKALSDAADISGLVFKTDESDYGKCLEYIVKMVSKAIKWDLLDVATCPVGLEEAAEDFQNKIMNQCELNATKIVVVAGMGGLGKSTLAKHLYNVKRSDFRRSCFLFKFRGKTLSSLQQKLVRDLLGRDVRIPNTSKGKRILRDGLSGDRILVVFDDVDDKGKIKSLLDIDAVEPGSLILITSRDKSILAGSSANTFVYDVKPLKSKHAQELFCRHAFRQSKPFQGYETLVKEFLKICGGLPLCLKVLGKQLADNPDRTYWMLQLNNYFYQGLPVTEADAVIKKLIWSYEALNTEQMQIFLDIGCFLVGEDKELAIRVLEGLGWYNAKASLDVLRQKCFLDFRSDAESEHPSEHVPSPNLLSKGCYKIIMHEQLRELARHIARKEFDQQHKPLRVSCSYDLRQILQLQSESRTCEIRGIRIPQYHQPPQLTINITGVRLLVVEHQIDFSWFLGSGGGMIGNLLWLRLCNCSLSSIPLTISLQNLRVLELEGPVSDLTYSTERVVNERWEYPGQLQELNIQFHKEASLDSMTHMVRIIGQSINLNKIELKNITNMLSFPTDSISLTNLHFSMLTNLKSLDLSGCTNLIQLPNSLSKCLRLQYLALTDCKNLPIPTDILGEISTLEYVDFSGCAQLQHLPIGMAYQESLRFLDIRRTSLLQLPDKLEQLKELEDLRIGSPLLTGLPDSFGDLTGLKELILWECPSLQHIGTSLKRLTKLERLLINNWGVPSSFMQVEGLPSSLVELKLLNCSKLKELTNLSNLVNLKLLYISSCGELETVNVEDLIQLDNFQAYECRKLQRIGALSQRERLNCLGISTSIENEVICNDFLQILGTRSQISTAVLSVRANYDHMIELEKVRRRILSDFENLVVLDITATTIYESPRRLENLHLYAAVLMCLIPDRDGFGIRFEALNSPGRSVEYQSINPEGSGMLDICMWTEDSKLFNHEFVFNNLAVYSLSHDGQGKGWIVLLERKNDGLEIFKQFVFGLR